MKITMNGVNILGTIYPGVDLIFYKIDNNRVTIYHFPRGGELTPGKKLQRVIVELQNKENKSILTESKYLESKRFDIIANKWKWKDNIDYTVIADYNICDDNKLDYYCVNEGIQFNHPQIIGEKSYRYEVWDLKEIKVYSKHSYDDNYCDYYIGGLDFEGVLQEYVILKEQYEAISNWEGWGDNTYWSISSIKINGLRFILSIDRYITTNEP